VRLRCPAPGFFFSDLKVSDAVLANYKRRDPVYLPNRVEAYRYEGRDVYSVSDPYLLNEDTGLPGIIFLGGLYTNAKGREPYSGFFFAPHTAEGHVRVRPGDWVCKDKDAATGRKMWFVVSDEYFRDAYRSAQTDAENAKQAPPEDRFASMRSLAADAKNIEETTTAHNQTYRTFSPPKDTQPAPKKNDRRPVWDMVLQDVEAILDSRIVTNDMRARDELGEKRYGTRLQAFNGRIALKDAYEEILDFCAYMRQYIAECQDRSGAVPSLAYGFYRDALKIAVEMKRTYGRQINQK